MVHLAKVIDVKTVTVGPEEIRDAVPMSEAIGAVRQAFIDLAAGDFEMPNRLALGNGRFLVMSAHHRPSSSLMVKTLSLDFDRTPAITGTVVWSENGRIDHLVADAGAVTMIRTGAIVGVATDLLAASRPTRLVLIGAGAQGADQVRAVHAVRPLTSLTVVDRDPQRAESLLKSLADELGGVELGTHKDADSAVGGADVVCCATNAEQPLFRLESLPDRVHVNAIGSFRPNMRELPDELLGSATILVDDCEAIVAEAGEIIHAMEANVITRGDLRELGPSLAMRLESSRPKSVFKTVGVAVQDWAIAQLLATKFLP